MLAQLLKEVKGKQLSAGTDADANVSVIEIQLHTFLINIARTQYIKGCIYTIEICSSALSVIEL